MKIITIAAWKGGVGKTNFCYNLSAFLGVAKQKKVLVVDMDPQSNLSNNYGLEINESLSRMLFQEEVALEQIIVLTDVDNVSIIPTSVNLLELEQELFGGYATEKKLHRTLRKYRAYLNKNFDYLIFDTAPTLSRINVNVLLTSDSILILSDNGYNSYNAIELLYNQWGRISEDLEVNNNIKAVVLNKFNNYKQSKSFIENISQTKFKKMILKTLIKNRTAFQASESSATPIILSKNISKKENPYFDIYDELVERKIL